MTPVDRSDAASARPGAAGEKRVCLAADLDFAPTRRPPRLARVWYAVQRTWLSLRLKRVEAELRALKAPTAGHRSAGDGGFSREDIVTYESCCMERAVLHAQIARYRLLP
jgi:hypothetical protein